MHCRKHDSSVVNTLASRLEVQGSVPVSGEENLVAEHVSIHVICRDHSALSQG